MFATLSDKLSESFRRLRGKGALTENDVDETLGEIRRALIDADVALPVVRQFVNAVREKAYGAARSKALNPGQQVVQIVNDELVEMLGGHTRELKFAGRGSTVFMLAGLQGAGKTTLAGKLGKWLHESGKTVLLVASDLQRPNAVTQLEIVGKQAGVEVWSPEPGNGVGDPVEVARSGLHHANENGIDIVIVDTAGRLGVDEEMMQQARDIRDAISPHEIMFVLDAMVGQDAVQTSVAFRDGVGFTGVAMSKLDGDARGGAALSVRGVTGVPILFASTGENLDDFERFHPDRMAGRILDMGDILTLIEEAEKKFDEEETAKIAQKVQSGDLSLEDFLTQLQQMRKLGSMKKILGMMPGAAQIRDQLEDIDDKEVNRVEAIVRSMTPAERKDVKILNGSRRQRIAHGSGTTVTEVNQLVKRFEAARKMMTQMGGASDGVPDFSGMGGKGRAATRQRQRAQAAKQRRAKKKARSGNPAKRRQQELEAMLPAAQRKNGSKKQLGPANGIDMFGGRETLDDLPDDLKRLLK